MPEERKSAPLPPEPWTANEFGPCTQNHVVVRDADGKQVALIPKSQLIAIELAELVCRAPALEEAARELVLAVDRLDHPDPERLLDRLRAALENANG